MTKIKLHAFIYPSTQLSTSRNKNHVTTIIELHNKHDLISFYEDPYRHVQV